MTTNQLLRRVHQRTRAVIDTELDRLAHRVPALGPTDLAVVDAALEELAERMLLARLRTAPPDAVPLFTLLFDPHEEAP